MAVEIRPAVPEDARAIAEVHVASWRWAYRGMIADAYLDGLTTDDRLTMWTRWFDAPGADAVLEVATADGVVVGFIECGRADGERSHGEVHALYVEEGWAGRAIGSQLLRSGMAQLAARGFAHVVLWVLATNTPARRFYEARGWATDGAADTYTIGSEPYPIVRYAIDL